MKNYNNDNPQSFLFAIVSLIVGIGAFIYLAVQILKFIQSCN